MAHPITWRRRCSSFSKAARIGVASLGVGLLSLLTFLNTSAPAALVGMEADTSWGIDLLTAAKTVSLERQAGVIYAREGVWWVRAQPDSAEGYSRAWQREMDAIVRRDLSAGIMPILAIHGVPYWASADPEKRTDASGEHWDAAYKPSDFRDYARFVAYVVRRYSRLGVHVYEIWNEPNLDYEWPSGVDAREFAVMLKEASAAARQADPEAVIISGGLAPADNLYEYARELYEAGAGEAFDHLGLHLYPRADPQTCWSEDGRNNSPYAFCAIRSVRELMVSQGDRHKQIWLTELGWSTCPLGTANYPCVTEADQALNLTAAYRKLGRDYPYVGTAVWCCFRDTHPHFGKVNVNLLDPNFVQWIAYLGLVDGWFREKPGYAALREYALGQVARAGRRFGRRTAELLGNGPRARRGID